MGKSEPPNLLELRPSRRVEWEAGEGGLAVLLVPRFRSAWARRLLPLRRPTFRVSLDEFGSFVWQRLDGSTPVARIAEEMQQAFGPRAEPVHDRIGRFLARLEREEFVRIDKP